MFSCTPVFQANLQATEKILINQGGTSSSKTYSIMQLLFLKAIEKPLMVITVAGQDIPNLKKGAYRDAETIYGRSSELQSYIKFWNRSERIIQFKNGSIIEFNSYENEQDAKNGKRDYLFVNEANGISWLVFFQLAIRTRQQVIIDYNPTAPFWSHDNLIGTDPSSNELSATVKLIISDHRHNTFLTEDEHRKIEGIKDKQLWEVYARGKTGNITGLIYPDWQKIEDEKFHAMAKENDNCFFGIDFGYTNDPTAAVKCLKVGESIFIHELCYTPGIVPLHLKQLFEANGANSQTPIYCEHDPDMIAQVRRLGLIALPARKGQGSINAGILKLKEYKVFYTASSSNIDNERKRYVWLTDKSTGKNTNIPIDEWNHVLDASRYAVYSHFYRAT